MIRRSSNEAEQEFSVELFGTETKEIRESSSSQRMTFILNLNFSGKNENRVGMLIAPWLGYTSSQQTPNLWV